MTRNLKNVTLCVALFALLIDRGDGRWKRKDREKLEQDIVIFRKMAENIEHDIEDFYDDYPDEESLGDNSDKIETPVYSNGDKENDKLMFESLKFDSKDSYNQSFDAKKQVKVDITNEMNEKSNAIFTPVAFKLKNNDTNDVSVTQNSWPKFEDILLALGKRYDWKNDRWIKEKEKLNKTSMNQDFNHIRSDFLSKHKFNYRTVKLNRSKSKRNIIIAVKAVR